MELNPRLVLASSITMQLVGATIAAWALLVEGYDRASTQARLIGSLRHWTILLVGPFACVALISVVH